MVELTLIRDFLAAGGDLATVFFAWALWKVDRRLLVLEQKADA